MVILPLINLIKYNIFDFILFKINRYNQYYANIISALNQSCLVVLLILLFMTFDIISIKKARFFINLKLN